MRRLAWPCLLALGLAHLPPAHAQAVPASAPTAGSSAGPRDAAAVALGLSGPATQATPRRWSALQGTEYTFGHFLVAQRPGRRGQRTVTPSDLDVQVASDQGRVRLVPQGGGWALAVDTRDTPAASRVEVMLSARSASLGLQWRRSLRVDVLPTSVERVALPANGARLNLGQAEVRFGPRAASGGATTAIVRWARLPDTGSHVFQIRPEAPSASARLPRLEIEATPLPRADAAPEAASRTIAQVLDETVPYQPEFSADQTILRHIWQDFDACYISEGEQRLPVADADCVLSPSGQLTGLVAQGREKADWAGVTPVLFIHGYANHVLYGYPHFSGGKPRAWGNFPEVLRKFVGPGGQRYAPFEYRWNTDAEFIVQGGELAKAINAIYLKTGQRVVIVGYSFGGVLARTVLQNVADKFQSRPEVDRARSRA